MNKTAASSSCGMCGATSYRRAIARSEDGTLRPTDLYQCSGCSVVFADPKAWQEGGSEARPAGIGPTPPPRPSTVTASQAQLSVPQAPNLATYVLGRRVNAKES